jgi:hypothetical protein
MLRCICSSNEKIHNLKLDVIYGPTHVRAAVEITTIDPLIFFSFSLPPAVFMSEETLFSLCLQKISRMQQRVFCHEILRFEVLAASLVHECRVPIR